MKVFAIGVLFLSFGYSALGGENKDELPKGVRAVLEIGGGTALVFNFTSRLNDRSDELLDAAKEVNRLKRTLSKAELQKQADDLTVVARGIRGTSPREADQLDSRSEALRKQIRSAPHGVDKTYALNRAEAKFEKAKVQFEEELDRTHPMRLGKKARALRFVKNGVAVLLVYDGAKIIYDIATTDAEPQNAGELSLRHVRPSATH